MFLNHDLERPSNMPKVKTAGKWQSWLKIQCPDVPMALYYTIPPYLISD